MAPQVQFTIVGFPVRNAENNQRSVSTIALAGLQDPGLVSVKQGSHCRPFVISLAESSDLELGVQTL